MESTFNILETQESCERNKFKQVLTLFHRIKVILCKKIKKLSLKIAENLSSQEKFLEFSGKSLNLAKSLSLGALEFSEKC